MMGESDGMKANPGGQIPPSQVIGRDELIGDLWRILERQSLVLSAERRIGKTCLIGKMISDTDPSKRLPVYSDLERAHSRIELVEELLRAAAEHMKWPHRIKSHTWTLLSKIQGVELPGIKLPEEARIHWKGLLTGIVGDLTKQQQGMVVLFWDEFPLFLDNVHRQEGLSAATKLLDVLRFLRQSHSNLRMVFTGSIGLSNVIDGFRKKGYANEPLNGMYKKIVPALSRRDATVLAQKLLIGERIATDDLGALATAIATAVDDVPYYIHHLVDQLAMEGEKVSQGDVERIVAKCLADPTDPWDLRHFGARIETYYSREEAPFARHLLDVLAGTEEPLEFKTAFNRLKAVYVTEDRKSVGQVLKMLQRDHYLTQEVDGRYRFVFPLIRRWWRLQDVRRPWNTTHISPRAS